MPLTIPQRIAKKSIHIAVPVVRLYWRVFKPRSYGVKVVIQNSGDVLCIKNSYHYELWSFVGGGVKRREKPSDAARREVREEVGITVRDLTYCGVIESDAEGKRDIIYVFTATSSTRTFEKDDFEVDRAEWFSGNELPDLGPVGRRVWGTVHKLE